VVAPVATATARVTWDVNYAGIRMLAVVIARGGILSWIVTRAGGINDGLRIVRALGRVVSHCSRGQYNDNTHISFSSQIHTNISRDS